MKFEGGIVFVTVPGVLLVTYTSIRQTTPAAIVAFVKVIVFAPVTAVRVANGPQLVDMDGLVELLIVTPGGRLSVTEKFVRSVSWGARIFRRKRELSPALIVLGVKDLFADIPAPVA